MIDNILEERGSRYGEFKGHAELTQALRRNFSIYSRNYSRLTPSMVEAIEMIFHKLGRIGNGDPTYLDSWIDIVGYTQLVINELKKQQQQEVDSPAVEVDANANASVTKSLT